MDDESLLAELRRGVEPCGENGQFHTFVGNGPTFREPIPYERGELVERDGLVYCNVLPR